MDDLITIDDKYTEDQLLIFAKHKIHYPKEGDIVQFLRVDNLRLSKKKGIFVIPHDNQWIKDEKTGYSNEVSFRFDRFSTLLGQVLTEEMVIEEMKNSKKPKEIVEIIRKSTIKELSKNIPK